MLEGSPASAVEADDKCWCAFTPPGFMFYSALVLSPLLAIMSLMALMVFLATAFDL